MKNCVMWCLYTEKRIRYTGKCHKPNCKKNINEKMAKLLKPYWFYCEEHYPKESERK